MAPIIPKQSPQPSHTSGGRGIVKSAQTGALPGSTKILEQEVRKAEVVLKSVQRLVQTCFEYRPVTVAADLPRIESKLKDARYWIASAKNRPNSTEGQLEAVESSYKQYEGLYHNVKKWWEKQEVLKAFNLAPIPYDVFSRDCEDKLSAISLPEAKAIIQYFRSVDQKWYREQEEKVGISLDRASRLLNTIHLKLCREPGDHQAAVDEFAKLMFGKESLGPILKPHLPRIRRGEIAQRRYREYVKAYKKPEAKPVKLRTTVVAIRTRPPSNLTRQTAKSS